MQSKATERQRFRPALETLETRRVPAVLLNEISVNLPGGTDTPWEYAELRGPANTPLTNIYYAQFEGKSDILDPTAQGKADFVQSLTGFQLGSNGLLVIKATSGGHAMPSGTTVVGNPLLDSGSSAFENGASTYMLINSTTPITTGTDYDTDDNNVLELPGGAVVLDSVGWFEDYIDEFVYTNVILDQSAGTPDAAVRFTRTNGSAVDAWFNGDLTGTSSTLDFDLGEISPNFPNGGKLTPGAKNSHAASSIPPTSESVTPLPIPPVPGPKGDANGENVVSDATIYEHRTHGSAENSSRPVAHVPVSSDPLFAELFHMGL